MRTICVKSNKVTRSGVDLLGSANLVLHIGDALQWSVKLHQLSEQFLGNTLKRLNEPHVIQFYQYFLWYNIRKYSVLYSRYRCLSNWTCRRPTDSINYYRPFCYKFRLVTYTTQSANLMLRDWHNIVLMSQFPQVASLQNLCFQ